MRAPWNDEGNVRLLQPNSPATLRQYTADYFVAEATKLCDPSGER